MIHFKVEGYFTKTAAENIINRLNGETFMNFHVYATNSAGNCIICVETEYDTTEHMAKAMFYNKALNALAGF